MTIQESVDNFDSAKKHTHLMTIQESVEYYINRIKNNKKIVPICLIKNEQTYILCDGSHRLVANYIAKHKF